MAILKHAAGLCRLPIAFFTAYSALAGYLLAGSPAWSSCIAISLAVLILAAGASCLNQFQERDIDARMERTRLRPLPAGQVRPGQALVFALTLICTGLAILVFSSGPVPFTLAFLGVAWYNGLYTRLKRFSAFSAVPGTVVGMIPPAIGWAASGCGLKDPRILALCFCFFLWQIPHFWIQLLRHGQEYEQAGLPALTSILSRARISRMIFVWTSAAAVAGLMLPLFGAIKAPLLYYLLIPGGVWLISGASKLITVGYGSVLSLSVFRVTNAYILFVMSLVSLDTVVQVLR